MVGVIATHLYHGETVVALLPLLVLVILGVLAYVTRRRAARASA